jgi:hypothetical protein
MSIKTLRKRIALVAVSALGVGLLSVAPASAAAGAFTDFMTTQYCSSKDANLAAVALDGNVRYLTVAVGSAVVVEPSDAAQILVIAGTGGYWDSGHPLQTATVATEVVFTSPTVVTVDAEIDATDTVVARASSVGSFTIKSYDDANDPSYADQVTVTVIAACDNTTFSSADSFVELQSTSATADDNVDDATQFTDGSEAYLAVVAKNAYGNVLPVGVFTCSATNGAYVDIASADTPAVGTLSTSSDSVQANGTDIRCSVYQAEDYKATDTVLTLTYNGVAITTKSIKITGDLAKIEVSSVGTATTNDQNFKSFKVRTFDNAGNQIAWADAKLTVEGIDQNITAADAGITLVNDYSWATNTVTCPSGAKGTSTLKVKGVTNQLTAIYSTEFKVTCASTPYTWTVSMDKASYVPGDIATVTILAKDANGMAVADPYDTDNGGATPDTFSYVYGSAGTAPSLVGSQLTSVVAPAAGDYFLGGAKKYQFVVGSTEGSYQLAVTLGGITTDSAKTVAYSVKSASTAVTNAEVLAAIVKLIASINKQIKALQKSLKK